MAINPLKTGRACQPAAYMGRLLKTVRHTTRLHHITDPWHDRARTTHRDVHGVGALIIDYYLSKNKTASQDSATGETTKLRSNHRPWTEVTHAWTACDLNPRTTDPNGRDSRKKQRVARGTDIAVAKPDTSSATPAPPTAIAANTPKQTQRRTSLRSR